MVPLFGLVALAGLVIDVGLSLRLAAGFSKGLRTEPHALTPWSRAVDETALGSGAIRQIELGTEEAQPRRRSTSLRFDLATVRQSSPAPTWSKYVLSSETNSGSGSLGNKGPHPENIQSRDRDSDSTSRRHRESQAWIVALALPALIAGPLVVGLLVTKSNENLDD